MIEIHIMTVVVIIMISFAFGALMSAMVGNSLNGNGVLGEVPNKPTRLRPPSLKPKCKPPAPIPKYDKMIQLPITAIGGDEEIVISVKKERIPYDFME